MVTRVRIRHSLSKFLKFFLGACYSSCQPPVIPSAMDRTISPVLWCLLKQGNGSICVCTLHNYCFKDHHADCCSHLCLYASELSSPTTGSFHSEYSNCLQPHTATQNSLHLPGLLGLHFSSWHNCPPHFSLQVPKAILDSPCHLLLIFRFFGTAYETYPEATSSSSFLKVIWTHAGLTTVGACPNFHTFVLAQVHLHVHHNRVTSFPGFLLYLE